MNTLPGGAKVEEPGDGRRGAAVAEPARVGLAVVALPSGESQGSGCKGEIPGWRRDHEVPGCLCWQCGCWRTAPPHARLLGLLITVYASLWGCAALRRPEKVGALPCWELPGQWQATACKEEGSAPSPITQ